MSVRLPIHLAFPAAFLCVLSLPAAAASPPVLPLPLVPNTAQERLQTQMSIQQAQAQAQLAADQAKVQAQLDANQARLQGRMAVQQVGTQAQVDAARERIATDAQLAALSLPLPMGGPVRALGQRAGNMELTTLTPRLGHYFGTDHGILVVRAPMHGVLKLQDGDVILSIGGRIPASTSQAIRILTSYDPGEKIKLEILREHHRLDITTTMSGPPRGP
jgi:S1-C subfamily serine protease